MALVFLSFFLPLIVAVPLGIVTGGIYTGVPEALDTNVNNVSCEWVQLGVRWARMEANWAGTTPSTYQTIVPGIRNFGINVLIIVPARYCGDDSDTSAIDSFTTAYVNQLNTLATTVFVGNAQVQAFEIGNEVNIYENGCGDGVSRFRVSPNAFAWLLRRVQQWRDGNNRPETIVSGGLLNTYTTESFWPAFFQSGAFFTYPGSRPFDYFGIHPYDPYTIDQNCLMTGSTNCFSGWVNDIETGLRTIAADLDSVTSTKGTTLFVTEFGLQTQASCAADTNCVYNWDQQAAGMNAAANAISASGVVNNALWYDYRDDSGEAFGLRQNWNGANYPAKTTTWNQFASLAGGKGGNPEQCW